MVDHKLCQSVAWGILSIVKVCLFSLTYRFPPALRQNVGSSRMIRCNWWHYNDVMMCTMASQITSLTSVYSTVYSGADQRKHQSSASVAFVWGIHRGPVNSPHKWPVTRKMFPFDDVIMEQCSCEHVRDSLWYYPLLNEVLIDDQVNSGPANDWVHSDNRTISSPTPHALSSWHSKLTNDWSVLFLLDGFLEIAESS